MSRKRSHSNLNSHKRVKKTLQSPWNAMRGKIGSKVDFSSWIDSRLPELTWLALARSSTDQKSFVTNCHSILDFINKRKDQLSEPPTYQPTHNNIAKWPAATAQELISLLVKLFGAETFRPISLLKFFPDIACWSQKIPESIESDWAKLTRAIAGTLDHQSQPSTDIRWFLLCTAIAAEKMKFPRQAGELIEEIRQYPEYGDQRKVRPTIRAAEMALRQGEDKEKSKISQEFCDLFWSESYKSTNCAPSRFVPAEEVTIEAIDLSQAEEIYQRVLGHRETQINQTKLDPKSDAVFGLSLYGAYLLWSMIASGSGERLEGRMMLRTLFETFCTLKQLLSSADPNIWTKYRNYGSGQAKLVLLKMEESEFPHYVTEEELGRYANEDFWIEYLDIEVGAWGKSNLRETCEQLGIRDLYDKYYIWTSGFVHAHWMAVRDALFAVCTNPLHRLHRIPVGPRFDMPSTVIDGAKLVNLILDELNHAYPPFKERLKPKAAEKKRSEVPGP